MTKTFKLALAAALSAPLATALVVQPAVAATPQTVIGTADLEAAIANSNAKKAADAQRPAQYKNDTDRYQQRGQQLQAQINQMITKLQNDARAPNANQQALGQQDAAIKQLQQAGQQELNGILRPYAYSEAFVAEQIGDKLKQALTNAMAKYKVTVALAPGALLIDQGAVDLTSAVTAELNTLIPNATLVPPAGWEPREVKAQREAQQRQQQAAPAPAATTPTAPAPTTPRPGQPQRNN